MKLEDVENLSLAHPYIKSIERVTTCYSEQEANDAAHGELVATRSGEEAEKPVYRVLQTSIFHIGLRLPPKDPASGLPRTLDLSWPTKDFTLLVKSWEHYNERTMGVVVKYIKRWVPSRLLVVHPFRLIPFHRKKLEPASGSSAGRGQGTRQAHEFGRECDHVFSPAWRGLFNRLYPLERKAIANHERRHRRREHYGTSPSSKAGKTFSHGR
jgi:poly(A) polymerase